MLFGTLRLVKPTADRGSTSGPEDAWKLPYSPPSNGKARRIRREALQRFIRNREEEEEKLKEEVRGDTGSA